jgi:hypothetical protein
LPDCQFCGEPCASPERALIACFDRTDSVETSENLPLTGKTPGKVSRKILRGFNFSQCSENVAGPSPETSR